MVHFHIFQRFQVNIRGKDTAINKLTGLFIPFIKVNSSYQRFQGISENTADLKEIIVLIIKGELAQPHFDRDLIKLLAVDDLGTHLRKITLRFIRIFFKEEIADNGS